MPRVVMTLAILALVLASACAAPTAATPTKAPSLATPAATKPAGTGAGEVQVDMQNSAFNPKTVTVPAGSTVRWANKDDVQHTASARQGAFESGDMKKDATFSFKFNQAGTFEYFCKYHPNMTGTVTVQ